MQDFHQVVSSGTRMSSKEVAFSQLCKFLTTNRVADPYFREFIYHKLLGRLQPELRHSRDWIGCRTLKEFGFQEVKPLEEEEANRLLAGIMGEIARSGNSFVDLPLEPNLIRCFFNREVISIISSYLGVFPTLQRLTAWKTDPCVTPRPEQEWHIDFHGHRFVKLFFYLTDVFEGDGHHEMISKSNTVELLLTQMASAESLCAEDVVFLRECINKLRSPVVGFTLPTRAEKLLQLHIRKIIGKAGYGFIEDTSCMHRGKIIESGKSRIVAQATYVSFDSTIDETSDIAIRKGFETTQLRTMLSEEYGYSIKQIEKLLYIYDRHSVYELLQT